VSYKFVVSTAFWFWANRHQTDRQTDGRSATLRLPDSPTSVLWPLGGKPALMRARCWCFPLCVQAVCNVYYFGDIWTLIVQIWKIPCLQNNRRISIIHFSRRYVQKRFLHFCFQWPCRPLIFWSQNYVIIHYSARSNLPYELSMAFQFWVNEMYVRCLTHADRQTYIYIYIYTYIYIDRRTDGQGATLNAVFQGWPHITDVR